MKENEKHGSNEQPAPEKPAKELTEQQIQQRRKMIVFPLMLLVFAAIMWLIFAPSGGEEATEQAGLNTSLPTPEQSGIVADKRDAYVQQEMKAKQEAKMRSLEDFAFSLGEEPESEEERTAREEREMRMAPKPVEYYENPSRFESGTLHSSVGAYHDLNRQIGSFYEETQNEAESDREKELQERIDRLEAQLEDEQARQSAEEQQLALIEKSYQLASKYMNGGQNAVVHDDLAVTRYIPSAVPLSSYPFFRRSVLPKCFLPRRSVLPHSSLALLPAASHIQTGFRRCAAPVPADQRTNRR